MEPNELNIPVQLMHEHANSNSIASVNQNSTIKNHPGVYVPPPLIYIACFLFSLLLQRLLPLQQNWFGTNAAKITGALLIVAALAFLLPALRSFIASKNTVVTVKPAASLQTRGIYSITRNPMYLGLLLLYSGIAQLAGNWWTLLLLPVLILIAQCYIINKEEQYLNRAFGAQYEDYKKKVRRWL